MFEGVDVQKNVIVQRVIDKIEKDCDQKQATLISKFVKNFYNSASYDDLEAYKTSNLYGAALSFWKFIYSRQLDEVKIKIYNPTYETDGWESHHTVIEIIQTDVPFLIDSIIMAINRQGLTTHTLIHSGNIKFRRNSKNEIVEVFNHDAGNTKDINPEAPIFIEVDKQTNQRVIDRLEHQIRKVCDEISLIVSDWKKMRERVKDSIQQLTQLKDRNQDIENSLAFLKWIENDNFTFLGIVDYHYTTTKGTQVLELTKGNELGLFRNKTIIFDKKNLAQLTVEARKSLLLKETLLISKMNSPSSVHRPAYPDYIGIKLYDTNGVVIGERAIMGLFTSIAYNTNPQHIPLLCKKVSDVIVKSGLNTKSHAGKALQNIIDTLPRDELFQANTDKLLALAKGIYDIQDRKKTKLFVRYDEYGKFFSCLVFLPKEKFNINLREKIQEALVEEFAGKEVEYSTYFSESILARIHYVIRIDRRKKIGKFDIRALENKIVDVVRSWQDEFAESLIKHFGEEKGSSYVNIYKNAYSISYQEDFTPIEAVYDIEHIRNLSPDHPIDLNLYKTIDDVTEIIRFKIFQIKHTIPLSDVVPILENMGLKVISEKPYKIRYKNNDYIWVSDFKLQPCAELKSFDLKQTKELFQKCFLAIWNGKAENDSLNSLVLKAKLCWQEVSLLRSYAKYLKQIRFPFSKEYIEEVLNSYSFIVADLIQLFHCRFKPTRNKKNVDECENLSKKLNEAMNESKNLNEDTILRRYHEVILATTRTNYYQKNTEEKEDNYIALKIQSNLISHMPLPVPAYEIFVYSPTFEGIHLRSSKVARGGIRWSDRSEDFRTEILGLMKAQIVKNAVIVPSGAKGGFVVKTIEANDTQEMIYEKGLTCYKQFISGLLELTDNFIDNKVVHPKRTVKYDENDPYMVVAADKGTATFSDVANAIAEKYKFWLNDAFGSGGKTGYDHKKIGITARGAWESVKRHFRDINKDVRNKNIRVVGIGDMSGDVFGNGLLLSRKVKLIAAFNHKHIFIDPDPDVELSYQERKRLYSLPHSSWSDYDRHVLSVGGGIYNRWEKSIILSKKAQLALGTDQERLIPDELIKIILKSPVDLLWNGGIGTFVKAEGEQDFKIGDKNNDDIRINARELRCKVIGEGGNLGLTQLARIEYSLLNGLVYTDAIDNSAGVDCSDHEVNIKILLDDVVHCGDITVKQRNKLLSEMTDDVIKLVLKNNYRQTQIISLEAARANMNLELHARYINYLEEKQFINRELEYLPKEEDLLERKQSGFGLTKPEIAVLLAYTKTLLKEDILLFDIIREPYFANLIEQYFPITIRNNFSQHMQHHNLKREIIATQLSNEIINDMGFSFIFRMQDETGATTFDIIKAYAIVKNIFNIENILKTIGSFDDTLTPSVQNTLLIQLIRFMRRATRWILKNYKSPFDIQKVIDELSHKVGQTIKLIPASLVGTALDDYNWKYKNYVNASISESLAKNFAISRAKYSVLDIVQANIANKEIKLNYFVKLYFALGDFLDLNWLRTQIIKLKITNHWEAFSKEAIRDDLDRQQKQLSVAIYKAYIDDQNIERTITAWSELYAYFLERWQDNLKALKSQTSLNLTIFLAVIRELEDFTKICSQCNTKGQ